MSAWGIVTVFAERVPPGVWASLVAANLVATLMTWSTARRRMRRRASGLPTRSWSLVGLAGRGIRR